MFRLGFMIYVNYSEDLVNEALQIDISYNEESISNDIENLKKSVESKKSAMERNIDEFNTETSSMGFSTVHTSIIDYLNEKAQLEYLTLARSARTGSNAETQNVESSNAETQNVESSNAETQNVESSKPQTGGNTANV